MITPSVEPGVRPEHKIAKELAASNAFLLARLGMRFKLRLMAKLDEDGFESYHYSMLAMLDEGARHTQSTMAVALQLDPSRLVALLDGLEGQGLIERQRDPQDRRRHVVSITKAGKRQLARMREVFKQLEDEFLAPLDADARATLHVLLSELAAYNDPSCMFRPAGPLPPGNAAV
jgi:DNA-binding MarR family transcriptional regulator